MVIFRFDEVKEMRKLEEIEILRAIACLAVVMIHITAFVIFSGNVGKIPALVLSFINAFSVFAVPAFLVVSSYTLTYQYQDRKLELGRFYQKRFSRVVVPYIVWTCIYYGIFLILNTAQLSFPLLLKNLVFGDMVYHLYFVVLILQFYLLFFAFRYLWSRFNKLVMPLVYLVVNILFMRYANFMYIDRVFLRYIFFFALGGYMAYHLSLIHIFNILQYFFIYVGITGIATIVMAALGLDLVSAFTAVAATIGNIGAGLGLVGPMANYSFIPTAGKYLLSFLMLLGRLELYTVLALLVRSFWKE